MPCPPLAEPADRPLRRDAERNRQRILDAAGELFAERGLGVTLDDIAHHAGVGVGTVYRRFPDKELLIDALFEQRSRRCARSPRRRSRTTTRGTASSTSSSAGCERQARDRGLKELLACSAHGGGCVAERARAAAPARDRALRPRQGRRRRARRRRAVRRAADPDDARRGDGPHARRRARALAPLPRPRARRPAPRRAPRRCRCRRSASRELDAVMRRPAASRRSARRPATPPRTSSILVASPWPSCLEIAHRSTGSSPSLRCERGVFGATRTALPGADLVDVVADAERQRPARDDVDLLDLVVEVARALLEVRVRRDADQRQRDLLGAQRGRQAAELARDVVPS